MSLTSPISWLPLEVLRHVFAHLDAPLDLYHASLVCCDWRSVGLDSQLWEPHYWRFYRARGGGELLERYEQKRHQAMRIWAKQASSLIPDDWTQAWLYPQAASGVAKPFKPFLKGYLALLRMLDSPSAKAELRKELAFFTTQRWGLQGPDDPEKAAPELLAHLFKHVGRQPTSAELEDIESEYDVLSQRVVDVVPLRRYQAASLSPSSCPHFLRRVRQPAELPDFHAAFLSRMNRDEQLMFDLQQYIRRQTDLMDHMQRIVEIYGDQARELLAALAADQRVSAETVADFAQHMIGTRDHGYDLTSDKLHALDVHTRAASRSSQPRPQDFLAFQHAARHVLGHLQRREAVRSLRRLLASSETQSSVEWPLRQRVLDSCLGVEDSLQALGFFRSAEPSEVKEYLDLLTLHVWASVRSADQVLAARGLRSPESHPPSSQHGLSFCAREMATSILDCLLGLGFAVEGPGNRDANKNFIHSPLWNPSQRQTVVFTFLAIFCAVARRLGIPTTLVEVPGTVMALVIEDGPPPPGWTDENPSSQWHRFFVIPGQANERQPVAEYDQVEQWAATQRGAEDSNAAEFGTPMTPSRLLQGAASSIMSALDAARQGQADPPQNATANDDAQSTETPTTPKDDVAALRAYLSGRQSSPPAPLWPATRPSSLASSGIYAASAVQDSEYAVAWCCRLARAEAMGGPDQADAIMAANWLKEDCEAVAADGAYQGDVTLLLEGAGHDVKVAVEEAKKQAKQLTRSWERAQQGLNVQGEGFDNAGLSPLSPTYSFLRFFTATLFCCDQNPGHGLGGSGACAPSMRDYDRTAAAELLDPAHPINEHVKYRVGTIFKHRQLGYYGAVIGWDRICRMDENWIELMQADELPSGGRNQPFYTAVTDQDEAQRYVAQSQMEVVRVPAGATNDQVVAVLRDLIGLLNHRTVGKCFRTLRIEAGLEGPGDLDEGKAEAGGGMRLVMNAWMRGAWPHG